CPHEPPTSRKTLLRMVMRLACWLGLLSSFPSMLMPAATCRTRLFVNDTSSMVDQGAVPSWLRTVNRMENPFCACGQLYSSRLPLTRTRLAFFSSNRFLTVHSTPSNDGSPLRQRSGFER